MVLLHWQPPDWCAAMIAEVCCRMLMFYNNPLSGTIPSTLGELSLLT